MKFILAASLFFLSSAAFAGPGDCRDEVRPSSCRANGGCPYKSYENCWRCAANVAVGCTRTGPGTGEGETTGTAPEDADAIKETGSGDLEP